MSERKARWWPAVFIFTLTVLALIWVWARGAAQRQDQVLTTVAILAVSSLLLLIWLLFFSRLAWRHRLAVFGVGLVAVGAFFALFELRYFSGDLIPVFAWRWGGDSGAARQIDVQKEGRLAASTDYPQYLGPERNAVLAGPSLARDWDAQPPEELWRVRVGEGWSGFAVAGDFAITLEQHDDQERVVAYDLTTGGVRWSTGYSARHEDPLGGIGPRGTPAIHEGDVFALGATGQLSRLDQATGEIRWQRDVLADQGAKRPTYGVSASPLVLDDWVVVIAGGGADKSLVAYDRATGEPVWSGGSFRAAYSSPMTADLAGKRQILAFTQTHLSGHDSADGQILWTQPWPRSTESTSQPVVLPGDRVFLSSGYGIGGKLFQIVEQGGSFSANMIWESRGLKAKFTNVVFRDGFLYGLDDGILVCLDAETGERRWKRGRYGHGHVILVRDLLLVQSEKGEVALVEASPEEYRELGRFEALEGKSWNTPALAGDLLLVRNSQEAVAYRLPS